MSDTPAATQSSQVYEIKSKMLELEAALLASSPEYKTVLRDIHRNIKQDSELVTVLSEHEVSLIVRGLKQQTKTDIASKVIKAKKKPMAKMQVGLDL